MVAVYGCHNVRGQRVCILMQRGWIVHELSVDEGVNRGVDGSAAPFGQETRQSNYDILLDLHPNAAPVGNPTGVAAQQTRFLHSCRCGRWVGHMCVSWAKRGTCQQVQGGANMPSVAGKRDVRMGHAGTWFHWDGSLTLSLSLSLSCVSVTMTLIAVPQVGGGKGDPTPPPFGAVGVIIHRREEERGGAGPRERGAESGGEGI